MKSIKDARLTTLLSMMEGGVALADVGTDHGKLPVAALLSGKASRAVAIDISPQSLNKAILLAQEEGVPLRALVGDGLTPLKEDDVDLVVIAGMGAAEIVKILQEAPCRFQRYLFVPHKNAPLLRAYLKEINARIVRDVVVKEGKHFYFVIEADLFSPWEERSLWLGNEGGGLDEYVAFRLKKVEELLAVSKDPALVEEKEELIHAKTQRDRHGA